MCGNFYFRFGTIFMFRTILIISLILTIFFYYLCEYFLFVPTYVYDTFCLWQFMFIIYYAFVATFLYDNL